MRGPGTSVALSSRYGITMGLGVVLAGVAANLPALLVEPIRWLVPVIVLAAHAYAAVSIERLPTLQLGDVLRLLSGRDSNLHGTMARMALLIALPVLLGSIALFDQHQYAHFFNAYLLVLVLIGLFEQGDHDELLIHVVCGAGFILLASLHADGARLVLCGLAGLALLHGTSAYLLMHCYPDMEEGAARRLSLLVLRRNLFVLLGAALIALIGTGILHGALYVALWEVIQPGMERAAAADGGFFGLGGIVRLVAWLALSGVGAFFIVRMIGAIVQQRRAVKGNLMQRQLSDESNPLFSFRLFGLSRDWENTRKQIITAYLKTRNGLTRMGYELKISATPNEYFRFVSRRLDGVTKELAQLTELFLAARYAQELPPKEAAERARALANEILAKARQQG